LCRGAGEQGGSAVVTFRLLWLRVVIEVDDPPVLRALAFLANRAAQDVPVEHEEHFVVTATASGYQIAENGERLGHPVATPGEVLEIVYRQLHRRAFGLAAQQGWVRLHAAAIDGPWGRAAVVAASGTGKTTLACRLLYDGVAVAADESVLVRDGAALPFPRLFHLKAGIELVVPQLAALVADLPASPSGAVRAFDPVVAGFAWNIAVAPIDHVVLLSRDPGANSLEGLPSIEAMPTVVRESFPFTESTGHRLAQLGHVLRSARCWRLRSDSPQRAAQLIQSLPQ
jgi:hypothetical protein